ncbi:hypothetical protein HZB60_02450 [candidate division KSB1 bacterium]|nr:hypothetical protein [candidate division KSB1 bacterium]
MPSLSSLTKELAARPSPPRTLEILQVLAARSTSGNELLALHEALLFYKAYPRSLEVRRFCERELQQFYARVRALDDDERTSLDQSGVVGSRMFYAFDDLPVRWLAGRQQGQIDIDWEEFDHKDPDPLAALLPMFLTAVEADAGDDGDLSSRDLIEAARGKQSALAWLLDRFEAAFPAGIREHIYNPLQLPLALELIPEGPSRTLVDDGQPRKMFIWDPTAARTSFDLVREINRPLVLPKPVSRKLGLQFFDLVYSTLLIRHRELYPLTYGNPEEVYDIPLDRGIRIVWWFMQPQMRLPIEAGWGCIILKNNVPIGYGAGGLTGQRSEISINVFDTFRGGEAAWLYAQYGRICRAVCPAPWLVTRRWQLGGEGNTEGLVSGTYWFYDKLGFRSVDPAIRKIADRERALIAKRKGYRTPKSVLKKIAEADVVLSLAGRPPSEYREYPLGSVGLLATKTIAHLFNGSRKGLESRVLKECHLRWGLDSSRWTKDEKVRAGQMLLWALAIPDFDRWTARERQSVFELCRAKGAGCEVNYARALSKNLKFTSALAKLGKSGRD